MILQYYRPSMHCPGCDNPDVVRSHRANYTEVMLSWLRMWPLRCHKCGARWLVFSWSDPKGKLHG